MTADALTVRLILRVLRETEHPLTFAAIVGVVRRNRAVVKRLLLELEADGLIERVAWNRHPRWAAVLRRIETIETIGVLETANQDASTVDEDMHDLIAPDVAERFAVLVSVAGVPRDGVQALIAKLYRDKPATLFDLEAWTALHVWPLAAETASHGASPLPLALARRGCA